MKFCLIFTEDKNKSQIADIVASRFSGFTFLYGRSFWTSEFPNTTIAREDSLVIVVLTNDVKGIRDIAREIKRVNNQESVLVTSFDTEMERI